MRGRGFAVWVLVASFPVAGCGGGGNDRGPRSVSGATDGGAATRKPVHFVGFDVSPPLIAALKDGKIDGLVVQNPFRMGELGVEAVVAKLEGRPVEAVIPTGETMVTAENLATPEVARLIDPPKTDAGEGASLSGPKRKKYRIMVIPKGTTHEHWKAMHAGAARAADRLGTVDLIWMGPQREDDRLGQIQLLQSAVAAKVDGVLIVPLDSRALAAPVEAAAARGIAVVVADSRLESKAPASYVATDNYRGGVLAAERLGEVLGGRGKIILLRYAVGSASTEEREKGFTDTVAAKFPGITYLSDTEYAGGTADSSQQKAQNLVTRFRGQVDGIFCPNESSTLGMLRALDGAGMFAAARP